MPFDFDSPLNPQVKERCAIPFCILKTHLRGLPTSQIRAVIAEIPAHIKYINLSDNDLELRPTLELQEIFAVVPAGVTIIAEPNVLNYYRQFNSQLEVSSQSSHHMIKQPGFVTVNSNSTPAQVQEIHSEVPESISLFSYIQKEQIRNNNILIEQLGYKKLTAQRHPIIFSQLSTLKYIKECYPMILPMGTASYYFAIFSNSDFIDVDKFKEFSKDILIRGYGEYTVRRHAYAALLTNAIKHCDNWKDRNKASIVLKAAADFKQTPLLSQEAYRSSEAYRNLQRLQAVAEGKEEKKPPLIELPTSDLHSYSSTDPRLSSKSSLPLEAPLHSSISSSSLRASSTTDDNGAHSFGPSFTARNSVPRLPPLAVPLNSSISSSSLSASPTTDDSEASAFVPPFRSHGSVPVMQPLAVPLHPSMSSSSLSASPSTDDSEASSFVSPFIPASSQTSSFSFSSFPVEQKSSFFPFFMPKVVPIPIQYQTAPVSNLGHFYRIPTTMGQDLPPAVKPSTASKRKIPQQRTGGPGKKSKAVPLKLSTSSDNITASPVQQTIMSAAATPPSPLVDNKTTLTSQGSNSSSSVSDPVTSRSPMLSALHPSLMMLGGRHERFDLSLPQLGEPMDLVISTTEEPSASPSEDSDFTFE